MVSLLERNANVSAIAIQYYRVSERSLVLNTTFQMKIRHSSMYSQHKITHPHPSGVISYAMLRPPSRDANCVDASKPVPALVLLHGAGVEADSSIVRSAFDPLPNLCAWVLSPSGVTTWSGDDWRKEVLTFEGSGNLLQTDTWGWADVANSIYYIQLWIERFGWKGIGFDIERLLFTGHSNGGE